MHSQKLASYIIIFFYGNDGTVGIAFKSFKIIIHTPHVPYLSYICYIFYIGVKRRRHSNILFPCEYVIIVDHRHRFVLLLMCMFICAVFSFQIRSKTIDWFMYVCPTRINNNNVIISIVVRSWILPSSMYKCIKYYTYRLIQRECSMLTSPSL